MLNVDDAITAVFNELRARATANDIELNEDSIRLGCPALWDAAQRKRLLRLAQRAGIPAGDHTLIDEPVAAGVGWVRNRVVRHEEIIEGKVLVFDMGGGTLDIAVLDVFGRPGGDPAITVLSSLGLNEAGDVLDSRLGDRLREKILAEDPKADLALPGVDQAIQREARDAKVRLSSEREVPIQIRIAGAVLPSVTLTRSELEAQLKSQLDQALDLAWKALRVARLTYELGGDVQTIQATSRKDLARDVTYLLPVGGMSRVPAVTERLLEAFPHAELLENTGIASDEAVAAGLADPQSYERISLNRPAFDFVLQAQGREFPLYTAYEPLYPRWQVFQRTVLYFDARVEARDLPKSGTGLIVVRTPGGEMVEVNLEGRVGSGIQVPFGHQDVRLHLYTNGRVIITDGRGRTHDFKVSSWPAIRGANTPELLISSASRALKVGGFFDNRFGRDGQ